MTDENVKKGDSQAPTLKEELALLKDQLPEDELVSCFTQMVKITTGPTEYRQVHIKVQFNEDYPNSLALLEMESKHLSKEAVSKLMKAFESKMKECLESGKPQVLGAYEQVREILYKNLIIPAFAEALYIRENLITADTDTMKIRESKGRLEFHVEQGKYNLDFTLTVPENYPIDHVQLQPKTTNFPEYLVKVFFGQALQLAQRCAKPLKKPGEKEFPPPQPSLFAVARFLIDRCCKQFPTDGCQICSKRVLPQEPAKLGIKVPREKEIVRIYCNHLYHYKCLDAYMTAPPFKDGKFCPGCGERICHEYWTSDVKLQEAKWAHQEARRREIGEVQEFLR